MRFVLIKDLKQDRSMRPMINFLLAFILLFVIFSPVVQNTTIGLYESKVHTTFFGNEEEFLDPINSDYFLEYLHTQIFLVMMTMITLSAIFVRLSRNIFVTKLLVIITNTAALVFLASLALGYYLSPLFVPLYLLSYYLWLGGAVFMIAQSFVRLNFAKKL